MSTLDPNSECQLLDARRKLSRHILKSSQGGSPSCASFKQETCIWFICCNCHLVLTATVSVKQAFTSENLCVYICK